MSQHPDEDPVAHAGQKVLTYVSVASVAVEAIAQVAATRARERAATDERAAAARRAQLHAHRGHAAAAWAPVLDDATRGTTDVLDAGRAWAAAQAWRPEPDAERASQLAEDRLRTLRPDVMDRYDRLRDQGHSDIAAMTRVAPFFDQPPAQTSAPVPTRTAVTARPEAVAAADAATSTSPPAAAPSASAATSAPRIEIVDVPAPAAPDPRVAHADTLTNRSREQGPDYQRDTSVADDPRTPHVDERVQAVADATPQLVGSEQDRSRADALRADARASAETTAPPAARLAITGAAAANILKVDYPAPVTSTGAAAARAAASSAPTPVAVQTAAPAQRVRPPASR